jgi:hypothetical protein
MLSHIVFGLLAIIAGALAAANFVIEKLPNTKEYIEKMIPYQAVIGAVALVLSVLKLLDAFALKYVDNFTFIINLCCIASTAIVGFLLGFPMVQQFMANDENSKAKAEEIRKKLSAYQVIAGLIALGSGVYMLLYGISL